jgi:HEAT repeats
MNSELAEFPGTIKAPLDIRALAASASLICKGEAVWVDDKEEVEFQVRGEPVRCRRKVAVFLVDRIYAGAIPGRTIEIDFLQPVVPSSMEELRRGEYVLLFLVRKGGTNSNRYRFANVTTSKVPIGREPVPSLESGGSPLARITKVLVQSLYDPDLDVVLTAIEQLGELKGKGSVTALRPLVASREPSIRGAAIASLLKLGDKRQAIAAQRFLDAKPKGPQAERVRQNICDAVAGLDDPSLLPVIGPLLRRGGEGVRYAVVRALRKMNAKACLPWLVMALDDADLQVRYQAVMALAEITGHAEWGSPLDTFRDNEARYVGAVKAWSVKRGKR